MEVPKPQPVYNGAQRCGAVASDIEVVPDTDDEERRYAHAQGSTMAVRHAMSDDMNLDFEDDVSGKPIQVNVVARSCDAVKGKDASEHALVPSDDASARVPATAQQQYSSTHCRQSDSEPLASQSGIMYRRRRRIHDSGSRGMGEQRRLFEDLRAELTDALRFQQAMFLNARDDIAAQQNEAIEGLRGDMLHIVTEHRQMQLTLAQVGGDGVPSTSQTEVRKLEDVSQSRHSAAVAQGQRISVRGSDAIRGQSRGNALVHAVVGPRHEPVGPCSQYELGGPGIPQVMTGGMPSAALTQQYMSRESQMIPGGMPSGVPPSVCLPADAMCQPYVNNNVMQSQVAHTDMQRYRSTIPAPVESVRYFAPNTCSPVNARESAPRYTQSIKMM